MNPLTSNSNMNKEQKIEVWIDEGVELVQQPISNVLKTTLQSIPARYSAIQQPVSWSVLLAVAASLLLLISFNGYAWKDNSKQDESSMEEYFEYTNSGI